MAKARLKPSEDSVSFTERELFLANGPIKVGRSVGDLRPAPHNAYFHCKVLSRNHALIWFDTALQRFYVRDTKSSNGTFVNKQKIGPLEDGSECPPFEIFSGDVMQFGVEVQETTKKDKDGNPVTVTHGCITTQIKLFNPDGSEYLPPPSALDQQQHLQSVIATQDLYILNKYLKEAKEREVEVEKKLNSFLDVIQQLEKQAENGCENVIREDYLLSKIEILEAQVAAFSSMPSTDGTSSSTLAARENDVEDLNGEDAVTLAGDVGQSKDFDAQPSLINGNSEAGHRQHRIDELNSIKLLYEQGAKEYLNRAMLEKIEALDHVARVETELAKCQSECEYLKNNCLSVEAALKDLIQRHQDQLERSTQLLNELKDAEQQKLQLQQDAARDKRDVEARMDDANAKVERLSAQVSEASAESSMLKDQVEGLEAMRSELLEELEQYRGKEYCDEGAQTDLSMFGDEDMTDILSSNRATINDHIAEKHVQNSQMSLLADESSIHSTPSDRTTNISTPNVRRGRAGRLSSNASTGSNSDVDMESPFGENFSSSASSSKDSGRKSAESPLPSASGRRSATGRSVTPLRNSSRQSGVLDKSGTDSSTSSFALHEQQSVEQFLDSVGDSPSDAADAGERTDHHVSFLPSFPPSKLQQPLASFSSYANTNDDENNSPYYSPPLSPPVQSSRGGLFTRQDTLTEARTTMQPSTNGPVSSSTASTLEARLRQIEKEISNVAEHADYDGDDSHNSSSFNKRSRKEGPVQGERLCLKTGSRSQITEYILGAIAAAGVGFAWYNYNS